jgi:hypothetical protein
MKYTQCQLRKPGKHPKEFDVVMTTWIPSNLAKRGNVLKVKDEHNDWSDGWIVEETYSTAEDPPNPHQMIREHRKRTGDSLPKGRD